MGDPLDYRFLMDIYYATSSAWGSAAILVQRIAVSC
jgi:hypothetical protein